MEGVLQQEGGEGVTTMFQTKWPSNGNETGGASAVASLLGPEGIATHGKWLHFNNEAIKLCECFQC